MARPKQVWHRLEVWLTPQQIEWVKAKAELLERSRVSVIRDLINADIWKYQKEHDNGR